MVSAGSVCVLLPWAAMAIGWVAGLWLSGRIYAKGLTAQRTAKCEADDLYNLLILINGVLVDGQGFTHLDWDQSITDELDRIRKKYHRPRINHDIGGIDDDTR